MEITRIDVYHTAVPYADPVHFYRPTAHADKPIPIIRVETGDGVVGWGEGSRKQRLDDAVEGWLGRNPLKLELDTLSNPWAAAMYDLVGKAYGVPAWRLMGDLVREEVPVAYWSTLMQPAHTGEEAARAVEKGFSTYKIKAWRPDNIIEQVQQVAEAVGDRLTMVLDPNYAFETYSQTLRLARQLEAFGFIRCLEEPYRWQGGLHEYRPLRDKIAMGVAIHTRDARHILDALRLEAIDEACLSGTVSQIKRSAALMEAAGKEVWLQAAALGLGVAGAYATHLHAVIRAAVLPSDSTHFWREHDLLADERLRPENGMVTVPQDPGLGVEVDVERVEAYTVEHYSVSA